MITWNGTMTAKEFTADVQIYNIESSGFSLGEWYGSGIIKSTENFELLKEYQTNLGKICVRRVSYNIDGIKFDFQGSGKPNL